jgi:hypothetical protein
LRFNTFVLCAPSRPLREAFPLPGSTTGHYQDVTSIRLAAPQFSFTAAIERCDYIQGPVSGNVAAYFEKPPVEKGQIRIKRTIPVGTDLYAVIKIFGCTGGVLVQGRFKGRARRQLDFVELFQSSVFRA